MKNIYVIPTDKPSKLHLGNSGLILCDLIFNSGTINSQHIYITSDEEIKEGDWYLTFLNKEVIGKPRKCEDSNWNFSGCKKIILTTDQDLIANGVQAIDDEFLEWFIKNPSCEQVEVKDVFKSSPIGFGNAFDYYKIIIPREERERGITITHVGKPKQETLEEAAEKQWGNVHRTGVLGFIDGAKWKQERMYSEIEDFINWIDEEEIPREDGVWIKYFDGKDNYLTTKELFEQFKKK